MGTYMKNPPPKKVAQDTTKFTCWAASLESWIGVAKPGTPTAMMAKTQDDLIATYKDFEGAKNALMAGKAIKQVLFDFQMMLDLYFPSGNNGKAQKKSVAGATVLQRLMMKGYLWSFYIGGPGLGTFLGHSEVIYGITNSSGPDAELQVMDPWTATLTTKPVNELNQADTVCICWLENSPTWSDDMFRIWKAMVK
jgi:hypothetical protein